MVSAGLQVAPVKNVARMFEDLLKPLLFDAQGLLHLLQSCFFARELLLFGFHALAVTITKTFKLIGDDRYDGIGDEKP